MPEAATAVEHALRELAGGIETAPPSADLTAAILRRVAAAPVPERSPVRVAIGRAHDWLRTRLRWVVGLLLSLTLVGVGVSPVGAAVAEWFGFHGVVVTTDPDAPTGSPEVPPVDGELTLDRAAALAGFRPEVPEQLGAPDGISVSADRRLVSMSWDAVTRGPGAIRLDQFDAELAPYFWKATREVELVRVGRHEGLWFPGPHEVVVLDESGEPEAVPPRLAAQTLIWADGPRTFRLEGELTLAEAVDLAESVR
jgi:hypothetical protein